MRAMTERRRRLTKAGDGRLVLFFGARTPAELPYFGPLSALPKEFVETHLAFSRPPNQPKHYVQDLMIQKSDQIAAMLRSEHRFPSRQRGTPDCPRTACVDLGSSAHLEY